jgi:membrane associated rhomboid family serine protease
MTSETSDCQIIQQSPLPPPVKIAKWAGAMAAIFAGMAALVIGVALACSIAGAAIAIPVILIIFKKVKAKLEEDVQPLATS